MVSSLHGPIREPHRTINRTNNNNNTNTTITYQLAFWIVKDYIKIISFLLLLYTQIISLDFLYRVSITLPLILQIILKLKILTLVYLIGSYQIKLKTFYLVKPLTFYFIKASNSALGVVILPSFHSFNISTILAYSLLIIKAILVLIPLIILKKAQLKLSLLIKW